MDRREYLLTCLAEEAAEVVQACSKALRFGLEDVHPEKHISARTVIVAELNDMAAVIEMLIDDGAFTGPLNNRAAMDAKIAKVEKFMGYSRECGTLIEKTHE